MAQSHQSHPSPTPGKKAVRRIERLQAAYARTDERVRTLHERLARAEEKLARRAARLVEARAAVASPVDASTAESLDARAPEPNGAH